MIKNQDLTQGPITKTLLIFAIPTLISNVLQSLNGSINTIWVGQFLGRNALAATTNANIITFLLFSLVFGFGMAATVLVGQFIGRHDVEKARRAFGAAVGLCVCLSVVVSFFGWLFSPNILMLLKTPIEALVLAKDYLQVIFLAMPATLIMLMVMMGLRGSGDSMTPLIFMGLNVVLDIIFNPILIIGIGPFPEMGIAGAAVATVIASYGALFAMIFYIYTRDLPLRLRGQELTYIFPPIALVKVIVAKGFPMSLQMFVMATAGLVMVGLVNHEGVVIAAAYNVSQQLWTYLQMPAMAVGAAVSAMAAQNIGRGHWNRIGKITFVGAATTFILTAILLGLMLIFDRSVLMLFLGQEIDAVDSARHIQFLASWSFLFFGLAMVIYSTMRANGTVFVPLIFLFLAMYPVRLGFYYLTYGKIGVDAIWISFPVGAFALFLMALAYYFSGKWKKGKMLAGLDSTEANKNSEPYAEPAGRTKPTIEII